MPSDHLLVANPTSQSGKNTERIQRVEGLLRTMGIDYELLLTEGPHNTVSRIAEQLKAKPELTTAIAMGGDGTFADVGKGIIRSGRRSEVRLGMLPTGTANDQAKSFDMESDDGGLPRNVEILKEGLETNLDVGELTGKDGSGKELLKDFFFDSAGWGISPRILQVRNEDKKAIEAVPILKDIWVGKIVYVGAMLRTFLASYIDDDRFDASVTVDGNTFEWRELTDLIVKGTKIYGGAWVFDRNSQPDDGKFEVVPFTGKREWLSKAIMHFELGLFTPEGVAKLGATHTEGASGSEIEIRFSSRDNALPLVAQIDGEEFPAFPHVQVRVLPRFLRLIVPREHARPKA